MNLLREIRMIQALRSLCSLRSLGVAVAAASAVACGQAANAELPEPDDIESYYDYEGDLQAEVSGNVALIIVSQPREQLARGGLLWAKVGPYVILFTEETQRLLLDHPGLAGVRVVTRVEGGADVASALLPRDELSSVQWRRALNIAGQARRDGTKRVTLLEDLVRWGEEHTQFEYHPDHTRAR